MAPPDGPEYGAAQPLVGPYMGFMRKAKGLYDRLSRPPDSSLDTSRHEADVRRANDSFRQQAEADDAKKKAAAAKPPVKRIPKRAPTRTPARTAARR